VCKIAVICEYQDGRVRKNALCRKHGISSDPEISDWNCILAVEAKEESIRDQSIEHQEINELKRQLCKVKMSDLLDKMIDVAECSIVVPHFHLKK
jgi:transposase-like protein